MLKKSRETHAPPALIDSLPPELLAVIFRIAQPKRRLRYAVPFEVIVSHVCARWRAVAFDTPFLWVDIDIYSPRSLERVACYLQRSDQCPLNVRFDIWQSDRQAAGYATAILPTLDLTITHIARWRNLLIFAYYQRTSNAILSKIANLSAPVLERLRVVDDGRGSLDALNDALSNGELNDLECILAGGTPRLTSVTMDGIMYLPLLANVTILRLHSSPNSLSFKIDINVVSDLAAACPRLTTLSIHGHFHGHEEPTWPVPGSSQVIMASLRSLWFINENTLAVRILSSISMPSLESLWLDIPHHQISHLLAGSISKRPSLPSLKYLTLQGFDFYACSLYAKAFPTITALHLSYCPTFHTPFLRETLIDDNRMFAWSHVDTLVFRTKRDLHVKKFSTTLDDIVTERAQRGKPIKRVLLDKDMLLTVSHTESLWANTNIDELTPTNYDDPWWIMVHEDTGDQL